MNKVYDYLGQLAARMRGVNFWSFECVVISKLLNVMQPIWAHAYYLVGGGVHCSIWSEGVEFMTGHKWWWMFYYIHLIRPEYFP